MRDELPTRAQDLADAWRASRRDLLAGRMLSVEAARERRLIVREACIGGVLDEFVQGVLRDAVEAGPDEEVAAVTALRARGILVSKALADVKGIDWYSDEHETLADRKFADSQREDE